MIMLGSFHELLIQYKNKNNNKNSLGLMFMHNVEPKHYNLMFIRNIDHEHGNLTYDMDKLLYDMTHNMSNTWLMYDMINYAYDIHNDWYMAGVVMNMVTRGEID